MMFRDLPNEIMAIMTLLSKREQAAAVLATSLSGDHFADPRTKEIYGLIMALAKRRKQLPTYRTLQHHTALSSEAKELMDEKSYPPCRTPGDAEQVAEVLEKLRQGRVIISMYDDTMEVMQEEAADPEKAFAIIEKGMLAARSFDQEEALRIAKEGNLGPAVEELLAREKPNTIPTGFRDFDSEAGGLPRGGLTTIAASSGGGKSCMALQIAVNNFWRGNNVAIVTLEMSKEQMVGRLMANQSGVNYKNINLANLNDMQKARIRRTKDKMQKHTDDTGTRMDIFSMTDTTMSEIALQFRAFDYDLIEIDYINLLNKEDMDQKNEAQALGEIARLAKNQASATNAAWVVLAQLNEQGIVKYSRAIKEHSDYMLSWTYGDAEKESHIIEIDQQKSRNSAAFKFNLRENFKLQQFENVGSGETNSDVAVKKGKKKKKQERLPTAAPMPGMNFEDEDEDEL
jgi:replicative DNA helicase